MRDSFLPFSRPCLTQDDIDGVVNVLKSGWITTGSKAAQFEDAFKNYTGAACAVAMTSETSVMIALARAIGLKPGDEVITPSMTWVSMVNVAELFGAKPVFVDCDKDTLMVTPEAVEAAITLRTRLIVPVHFAGAPYDIDAIRTISQKHGVLMVEDAAHALGACYKGRRIGASGTAMFSFHPIKNITTGEGGIFASDDVELASRLRSLKFHGLGVDAYDRQTHGRAPQAQVMEPGYKFNMPDMQAVLGISQLERLEKMNARRAAISALYDKKIAEIPELSPLQPPPYAHVHSHHLYIVRINSPKVSRDEFMAGMKAYNIGTGLHFRCVHLQKYYREKYGFSEGILPYTEWNSQRICSLPLFPDMTEDDVQDVVDAAKAVLAR